MTSPWPPSSPNTAATDAAARDPESRLMRILFLGDVVGRTGRDAITAELPAIRRRLNLDFVVVNGENASHGFGLAPAMADAMFAAGADVITLGNHAWDRKELLGYIETQKRLIRPLNFPPGTPGQGFGPGGPGRTASRVLVLQVQGRLFMEPNDDPFRLTAELLGRHRLGATVDAIIADFHGEATSEKMAYGHSFDGRVSLVVGTHTHVPTADLQILPGGTAYQTDAGMCGDYDSVIGMDKGAAAAKFWRRVPGERLAPAEGQATLCGVLDRNGPKNRPGHCKQTPSE